MEQQKIFNFNFKSNYSYEDFFVSHSNTIAYNQILNKKNSLKFIILKGPSKSGKTHLGLLWQKNNDALIYNNQNYKSILNQIFIDHYNIVLYLIHILFFW